MNERKLARVQHHTWRLIFGQFGELSILSRAIGRVADERVAEKLKVDANLVHATRVQLRLK